MKVINLFGGPSCGKSTTASGIFYLLKSRHNINCEYISEYAKILAWENDLNKVSDQLYVTAKQNRGLERVAGKVEYAITDSPLLLGINYSTNYKLKSMPGLIIELFNSYDNVNFLLRRKKQYNPSGRFQTENQAKDIDGKIQELLDNLQIPYIIVDGDCNAAENIVKQILGKNL